MNILVPLAGGFEEIEAVTIVDVLRRAQVPVVTVATGENPVPGAHGITVIADRTIARVHAGEFMGIVLPGGMPGSANLRDDTRVTGLIRDIHAAGGYACAVCAAPIALARAGVLEGRRATCYPGFEGELAGAVWDPAPVVADGRIITGRGPGCAIPFALAIVEELRGAAAAKELGKSMQVLPA